MDGEFAEAGLQTEQSSGGRAVNTFNYSQRKKMKNREIVQEEEKSYKSELLSPEFMEEVRKNTGESGTLEQKTEREKRRKIAAKAWLRALDQGDYGGPELDTTRYLSLRDAKVQGNRRQSDD